MRDQRAASSTTHSLPDMIRAPMLAIACGYEDCDDLDVLRFDPAFKLACGRLSETGDDLMSQPTLSRLENTPSWFELGRMGFRMIDLFCDSFKSVPVRIVLDIDDTPDTVHGGQQLAFFNAHYDEYVFQPIHILRRQQASRFYPCFGPASDRAEKRRRALSNRSFTASGATGLGCILWFAVMVITARLKELGQPWCEDVSVGRVQWEKDKLRRFFQAGYQAKSWSRKRKVIAGVEATSKGCDIRFVVTDLPGRAKLLYEKVYCAR